MSFPSVPSSYHPRRHRVVRRLIDHDEAAGRAVDVVTVEHQRLLHPDANARDVVHVQILDRVPFQRVHVYAVVEAREQAPGRARGVLDQVFSVLVER